MLYWFIVLVVLVFSCGWFMLLFSFFVYCLRLVVNSVVVACSLCYSSALRLL